MEETTVIKHAELSVEALIHDWIHEGIKIRQRDNNLIITQNDFNFHMYIPLHRLKSITDNGKVVDIRTDSFIVGLYKTINFIHLTIY